MSILARPKAKPEPESTEGAMSDEDFYPHAWFALNEAAGAFALASQPPLWTQLTDAFIPVLTGLALNAGALDLDTASTAARQVWDAVKVRLGDRHYKEHDFVLDLLNGIKNRKYR